MNNIEKIKSTKIKSIVVIKPGQLEIESRDIPIPKYDELRIKVMYAGICGSDVHILHGSNPFAKYPRVIGHEFLGVIDQVGEHSLDDNHDHDSDFDSTFDSTSNEISLKIGDKVVVDPVVSCGRCYACLHDKPNVCEHLSVIGVHQDGGFSEYVCVPKRNAYLVPKRVSDQNACLIEPFAVAANITSNTKVYPDDIAIIYGAGPIGLMVAQVLKWVYKVEHLIVTDRLDERLKMALANGADVALNTQNEDLEAYLHKMKIKPTLIIDAACHPSILNEAINIAAPAARIGIMGFSGDASSIIQQKITSKELSIYSSRLNSKKFPIVIEWMTQNLIKPELLVTHQFDYQDIKVAMDIFENHPKTCCKVILNF